MSRYMVDNDCTFQNVYLYTFYRELINKAVTTLVLGYLGNML